jgi:DNA-binding response OmpR family regulator
MATTILVAEDEADIRNLLKIGLEEAGYSVIAAANGKEAWDALQSHPIQLAVLDVVMPGLDGFSLLRKIREVSTVPVVFLTARADDIDKVLGLGLGADDYLSKPFSMAELLARIGAHLRRSTEYSSPAGADKARGSSLVTYRDLCIDTDRCCAYRCGELIELSATEYRLLLHFMEHPEKVFTKRQLYAAVWGEEFYYDDNTVMVHISRLRNKIEPDPHEPRYLKTIRGIGYKLHYTGGQP